MIETERILMRKFTPDDLEILVELRSDDNVNRFIGGNLAKTREFNQTRIDYYISSHEKYGFGMCLMIWKETGEVFGWSGIQILRETGEFEVGYGMLKKFWRRGIGFECALAWLKFGFEEKNLERIVAVASPQNKGSWRIMEKLGMTHEKTGTFYNSECVYYGINRDAFLKQHGD